MASIRSRKPEPTLVPGVFLVSFLLHATLHNIEIILSCQIIRFIELYLTKNAVVSFDGAWSIFDNHKIIWSALVITASTILIKLIFNLFQHKPCHKIREHKNCIDLEFLLMFTWTH